MIHYLVIISFCFSKCVLRIPLRDPSYIERICISKCFSLNTHAWTDWSYAFVSASHVGDCSVYSLYSLAFYIKALFNFEVVLMNILHYTNFLLNEVSENAFINIKMLNKRVRGIVTDIIVGNFLLLAFVVIFFYFFCPLLKT